MGRTSIIILLIGLAFWGMRKLWRQASTKTSITADPTFEKTVQCEQCGVHVSLKLAHERAGKYYCCRQHLPE